MTHAPSLPSRACRPPVPTHASPYSAPTLSSTTTSSSISSSSSSSASLSLRPRAHVTSNESRATRAQRRSMRRTWGEFGSWCRGGTAAFVLMLAAAVMLPVPSTDALIIRRTFRARRTDSQRGSYNLIFPQLFGFKEGGSLTLRLDCDSPMASLSFLTVTFSQTSDWIGAGRPCSSLQSATETFNLTQYRDPESSTATPDYELKEPFGGEERSGFYAFVLRECGPFPPSLRQTVGTCQVHLETLNPGGDHLSRDQLPLPNVYLGLLSVWVALLLLWGINAFVHREFSNGLHVLLTLSLLLKATTLAFELHKYTYTNANGFTPEEVETARVLLLHSENCVFLITLSLIANGWCVLQKSVDFTVWSISVLLPVLFFISNLCQVWVHSYFTGLSIILILCIAVCIVRASGINIMILRHRYYTIGLAYRREAQQRVGWSLEQFASPLRYKMAMLQYTRVVFILYALLFTILELTASFLREHSWIRTLTLEVLEMAAYLVLLLVFRLRDFSPYEPPEAKDEEREIEVALYESRGRPFALLVPLTEKLLLEFVRTRARTRDIQRAREEDRRREQQQQQQEGEEGEEEVGEGLGRDGNADDLDAGDEGDGGLAAHGEDAEEGHGYNGEGGAHIGSSDEDDDEDDGDGDDDDDAGRGSNLSDSGSDGESENDEEQREKGETVAATAGVEQTGDDLSIRDLEADPQHHRHR